ncbi:MAG: ABC transporter substrate-binding protein [Oscillospiraceae bacterium]|nr:ABC transporter substrate-binding protein [Oscillospiraceae bacterium]
MKKRAILKFTAAAAAALIMLTGCTKVDEDIPIETTAVTTEPEKLPYPVTIGSLVFNDTPESAASLSPALTEIICELGFKEYLTGRSEYCTYPESAAGLAALGSAANPDVDAIIDNAPRLLVSQSPIAKKDITAIEAAETRVLIMTAPTSSEELYSLYSNIYRVFTGENDEEENVISGCFEKLESAFEKHKGMLESYVYLLSPELAAASDSTFAGDFFSHFGKNCAAETDGNTITAEELLESDPKWLILPPYMTAEDLPGELAELTAVKEERVIVLDEEISVLLERPTSRIYLAAEFISEKMNPSEESEAEVSEETSAE